MKKNTTIVNLNSVILDSKTGSLKGIEDITIESEVIDKDTIKGFCKEIGEDNEDGSTPHIVSVVTNVGENAIVKSINKDGKDYTLVEDAESPEKGKYKTGDGETASILRKSDLKDLLLDGQFLGNDEIVYTIAGATKTVLATYSVVESNYHVKAKYTGAYYSNVALTIERITKKSSTPVYYNFKVDYIDERGKYTSLERFNAKTEKTYLSALSASEFISIEDLDIKTQLEGLSDKNDFKEIRLNSNKSIFNDENKYSYSNKTIELLKIFWEGAKGTDSVTKYLSNRLETPIDVILDAGYPLEIKQAMVRTVRNDDANIDNSLRPDIVLILDEWSLNENLRLNIPNDSDISLDDIWDQSYATNIAVYEQYYLIDDQTFTSQNVYVTPTYFLSKLFPYNDNTYGTQYPSAGLRRGILSDALYVNENPDADTKEDWFERRVNYAEKSSREYAFMSQRTFDGSTDMEYTALSFLNNERVLEKIKKEIEALARTYLHEFNDAVTIANMTNALNKYIANWISNRTLSLGIVQVVQNAVSENALDVNLNIRFTNTIEVINVSIVIE